MKRFLVIFLILLVVAMALPSVLATADGGDRLHEIVTVLSEQLARGGDYPLHAAPDPEVSSMTDYYHQLILEGLDLMEEGSEEDAQALAHLCFVYDKEEARLKLYVDSTQLVFGITRSTAHAYWEEEWRQIAALIATLDEELAAAEDYDAALAAFERLREGVALVPTYDEVYGDWVERVDAIVHDEDAVWLGTINAALAAFDLGEVSLSPFSVEMSVTAYLNSVAALSKYYSEEDWQTLSTAHQALLRYFYDETDYHADYEETPSVVADWRAALSSVTVLLDADEVNLAIALSNARAALALYLAEDFLGRYSAEERARIERVVEQSYTALNHCTTPEEVAQVVKSCGDSVKADTAKSLGKTTIIAIVLGLVAVVLFILYFVFKYLQSRKVKHVDGQVFLAGLAKEIEEVKAKEAAKAESAQQGETSDDVPKEGESQEPPKEETSDTPKEDA